MTGHRPIAGTALAVLSLSASIAAAEQDGRLEMWEEPSHQLVFVDGPARVLDVRIVPGATSDYHRHRFATLYVIIQDALVASQLWGQEWTASGPRDYREPGVTVDNAAYVENPYYHRVRNEDERTFHVLAVINERPESGPARVAGAGGEMIDNRWFREHRVRVDRGAKSAVLEYASDVVVVQYSGGSSHIVEKGTSHGYKGAPGAFSWHPAGSAFRIANRSDTAMEFVLVEVKE